MSEGVPASTDAADHDRPTPRPALSHPESADAGLDVKAAAGSEDCGAMRLVDTRYGRMRVPVGDEVIGRFLDRYGEWAWHEASFLAGFLGEGARVLDGGAFLGTFGMGVCLCQAGTFVCYVEANPRLTDALRHNVDGSPGGSVVVPAMIGAAGAVGRVLHEEAGNLGATRYVGEDRQSADAPMIEATTLSELRQAHGPFDLIKLDLEGMEAEALLADAAFLSSGQTTLWLECNEDRRSLELARLVLGWELPVYYFAFPSFNARNSNGDPEPIYPMAYEAGLLVAPGTTPSLTEALTRAQCILKPIRSIHDLRLALWSTPRWGMAGWDEASKPELAALAGRMVRSESFEDFLHRDAGGEAQSSGLVSAKVVDELQGLLETERAERAVIDAALREASGLALARLDEISQEQERRAAVEAGLEVATGLAVARLNELMVAEGLMAARLADLVEERKGRQAVDAELARTAARALAHLEAMGRARDRAALAEAVAERVPHLEREADMLRARASGLADALDAATERVRLEGHRADSAEHVVHIVTNSTVWRVSAPIRGLIHRWSFMRSLARGGRRVAGRIWRRLRA